MRAVSAVRRSVLSDTCVRSVAYPGVNLYINGFNLVVCSSDVDDLNQRSDADALRGRGKKIKCLTSQMTSHARVVDTVSIHL